MKWLSTLRERLIKTGSGENYNPVYGGYAQLRDTMWISLLYHVQLTPKGLTNV